MCIVSGMTQETKSRINVSLPASTLDLLDRSVGKGNRSRLIDEAVRFYIEGQGRRNLRKLLREQSTRRAGRDRQIAEEWFNLERGA